VLTSRPRLEVLPWSKVLCSPIEDNGLLVGNLFPFKRHLEQQVISVIKKLSLTQVLNWLSEVKKVKESRYRPGVTQAFQEVKAPRLRNNSTGWW